MTIEEAIRILNAIFHIIPKEYYNEETEGAIDMAIRSLEAWGKVKEELVRTRDITEGRFDFGCCVMAIDSVLEIIDKHLKGVSE